MILLFRTTLEKSKLAGADVEAVIADLNARRAHIVRRRS